MRRFLPIPLLLLAGGCVKQGPLTTDYRFQYEQSLRTGTVYIRSCGTGWLVSPRHVVTNAHIADCVRERHNGYATIDFVDGSSMMGREIARSTQQYVDLALLRLEGRVGSESLAIAFGSEALPRDTLLMSVGNPAPSKWIPTTYRVLVQPKNVAGGLNGVIVMEGTAYYGDSGSPVMTLDGKVVGVVFARTEGHAYAVPVNQYLTELLREVKHNERMGLQAFP
jgi:S1-C subfamily serine protease